MSFKYPDTNSSRANIEYINQVFHNQKVAIIGMGGTGSYMLDFIAKTPVKEIHIYDGDIFQLHNAFRAPGAISSEKLESKAGIKKVDYFYEIYSKMHEGIRKYPVYLTKDNIEQLKGLDFVFISVDRNKVRSFITQTLLNMKIPFIDVGMGVNLVDNKLIGTMRVTHGTPEKHDHLNNRIGSVEFDENDYSTNIQIAELNCLNAILAIMKWKKTIGFYQDLKQENNSLLFINTNKLLNEDHSS